MEEIDSMETIPYLFDERKQNLEVYAQKKIYSTLKLLNKLPLVQNPSGNFTNYVSDDPTDVTGDAISTADGMDYNEIKFGEPSAYRGSTVPKGYMFKMNTRLEDQGKMDATLQVFMNKAVANLATYYDKLYLSSLSNGAGAVAPQGLNTITSSRLYLSSLSNGAGAVAPQGLNTITSSSTGIEVLENELKIIDAMEVKNDTETGFTPNTCFLPRADALAIKLALAKSNLLDDSNFEYIGVPAASIGSGHKLVMDMNNPTATVEKFADPNYSVIAQLEQEPEMNTELLMQLPSSFINIKMVEPNEPQRSYIYVFAESNVNILEPNGIMYI